MSGKGNSIIHDYLCERIGYFSKEALKLAEWSIHCDDRIKASTIKIVANKLEFKYRSYHEINQTTNRIGGHPYITKYSTIPIPPPPKLNK